MNYEQYRSYWDHISQLADTYREAFGRGRAREVVGEVRSKYWLVGEGELKGGETTLTYKFPCVSTYQPGVIPRNHKYITKGKLGNKLRSKLIEAGVELPSLRFRLEPRPYDPEGITLPLYF